MCRFHILSLLFLLVMASAVRAERMHSDYFFKHVTIADGLSSSQVNSICKDSRGFVWIGTASGLNRYDGYHVRSFKSDFSRNSSLPDGYVESIQEDADGMLWISTASGYVVMDPVHEVFDRSVQQRLSKVTDNVDITTLLIDKNKNMWIYAAGHGIYYYKVKMQLVYNFPLGTPQGLPSGRITGLCEMPEGVAVVFDDGTVCGLDGEHQRVLWVNNVLAKNAVPRDDYKVGMDSHQDIFVFSATHSYIYDAETHEWSRSLSELAQKWGCSWSFDDAVITCFGEDLNKFVWLSTDRSGIILLNVNERSFRRHLLHTSDSRSLPTNSVQTIYIDDSNLLWIGTARFGVSYWGFSIYRFILEDLGDVNGFSEDSQGNLWMATQERGLLCRRVADSTYVSYGRAQGLSDNSFQTVLAGRDGSIWCGSNRYGLNRLQGGHVVHYRHDDNDPYSLVNDNVTCLCEDMSGDIWVGTKNGGMQCLTVARNQFSNFNVTNSKLPSNEVTSICSKANKLVAGTSNGIAVVNLSTNQVEFFQGTRVGDKHFSNLYVTQVYIDSRGLIWVGTRDGLNLYNPQTDHLQVIGAENGLPSTMICGLTEDGNKHIWVTTSNGVSRLVMQKEMENGDYDLYLYNYNQTDGLQGTEFNVGSITTTRQGLPYFGGPNGVNYLNVADTQARKNDNKVVFTSLLIMGKRVAIGDHVRGQLLLGENINDVKRLSLPEGFRSFAIEMSVSNYYRSEHPQFVYLMEGLFDQWRPGDASMHGVSFEDLNPGKYTLHVKSVNEDGSMGADEHIIEIVIARPWWMTWGAIAIYILLAVGLFLLIRYGLPRLFRHMKGIQKERELFARRTQALRDITELLMSPISKVIGHINNLKPLLTTPEQREIADSILHIEHQLFLELRDSKDEDVIALMPAELRRVGMDNHQAEEVSDKEEETEVTPEEQTVEAPESRPSVQAAKQHIYLVDSDPDLADFITDSLKNYFAFTVFTTAESAWTAIQEKRPDLIIAYEQMSDMRGSELCVKVKRERTLSRIPFVLMLDSAMTATEFEQYQVTVAADDYVLHFFDLIALMVRCKRLLGETLDDTQMPAEEAMLTANAMTDGVNELIRSHVREYVRQNISNPKLPLEDLCEAVGIPLPQLFRKIELMTGKTPSDYIRSIRLSEAANLLKNTSLSPQDVATEVGFPNFATFSRFFKEQYELLPTEFCEQHAQRD